MKLEPMRATSGKLPDGPEWAYEIKWDGIRALVWCRDGRTRIYSRTLAEVTSRYPELAGLCAEIPGEALLDGEIVAFDEEGSPSFQRLQGRIHLGSERRIAELARTCPVTFMAFDVLSLDGRDATRLPYAERRALLEGLELRGASWQVPPSHRGNAEEMLAVSRANGLEGVVAKRLDSVYLPGQRSPDWVKFRHMRRQEFVVGGWRPGEGSRSGGVGSLLVGYWDRLPEEAGSMGTSQQLVYAGAVGSGLTQKLIALLNRELPAREVPEKSFDIGDPLAHGSFPHAKREPRYCRPELVCEVVFSQWTRDGTLRQPSFKGLRDDVDPTRVIREP